MKPPSNGSPLKGATIFEPISFSTPEFALSWRILRDIGNVVDEKPLVFLTFTGKYLPAYFTLWKSILRKQNVIILSDPMLLAAVESTVHCPIVWKRISFLLTFIKYFSERSRAKVNQFFDELIDQRISHYLMVFLRCAFFRKPELSIWQNLPITKYLIRMVNRHCDGKSSQLFDLGLIPRKLNVSLSVTNKHVFARTVALEFAMVFVSF
jgi:hypothetical protein